MKSFVTCFLCFLVCTGIHAQGAKEALDKLDDLQDQYGNGPRLNNKEGDLIILSVPTTDQPFRVYDQLQKSRFKPAVRLVGGFGNAGGHGTGMPVSHLKDGFLKKYGNEFQPVFLDGESEIAKSLGVKGHAIVVISQKNKKVKKVRDYGNKIDDFMKAIEEFKTK